MERFNIPSPVWSMAGFLLLPLGIAGFAVAQMNGLTTQSGATWIVVVGQSLAAALALNLLRDGQLLARCRRQLDDFRQGKDPEWPTRLFDDCLANLDLHAGEYAKLQRIETARDFLRRYAFEKWLIWSFLPLLLLPLAGLIRTLAALPPRGVELAPFSETFIYFLGTIIEAVVLGWITTALMIRWTGWFEDWSRISAEQITETAAPRTPSSDGMPLTKQQPPKAAAQPQDGNPPPHTDYVNSSVGEDTLRANPLNEVGDFQQSAAARNADAPRDDWEEQRKYL